MKKLVKIALIASLTSVLGFAYAASDTIVNTGKFDLTTEDGQNIAPQTPIQIDPTKETFTVHHTWEPLHGPKVTTACTYKFMTDADQNPIAIGYSTGDVALGKGSCLSQTIVSAKGPSIVLIPNVDS